MSEKEREIMLQPIKYKPAVFKITERARNVIKMRNEEDEVFFALEALRNSVRENSPKEQSLFRRFINKFYNQNQLEVILDSKDRHNFVLNTKETINKLVFIGKEVAVDIKKLISNKDEGTKLINESKSLITKDVKK